MIPVVVPVVVVGLATSLLLGSMGINNIANSTDNKPQIQQTANWSGLVRGIFKDYEKSKKKGTNLLFNVNEKKLEKIWGVKAKPKEKK